MSRDLLNKIIDREILISLFYNNYSLINGQMGVAIFFALLNKNTGNSWYGDFAEELINNVSKNLTNTYSMDFASGLCGIGWSIEFLKYIGYIENDTDEILYDIDKKIKDINVWNINDVSLVTGLRGIYSYVISRLKTPSRHSNNSIPFSESFLDNLKICLSEKKIPTNEDEYKIDRIWQECLKIYSKCINYNWQKGITLIENYE